MSEQEQQQSPSQEPPQRDRAHIKAFFVEIAETTATIAARLGETDPGPCMQIRRIVQILGSSQAFAFLQQTMQIEANGGMMLPDQSRRRTVGGIFFHLIRTNVPQPLRGRIFPAPMRQKKAPSATRPTQTKPTQPKPEAPLPKNLFAWEDRIAALEEIGTEKGRAQTVKITLIGTMGTFTDKGSCVVGVMQHNGEKLPALPKGVPTPQATTTEYVVYIGAKQWKNVAATVSDPEDMLIVDGFPQIDIQTGSISVFATSITSKKLQQTRRTATAG